MVGRYSDAVRQENQLKSDDAVLQTQLHGSRKHKGENAT